MTELEPKARKVSEPNVPQHVIDAFEKRYRSSFDLSRDDDDWRNTWRYKHDHIQSMWSGWRDCYIDALDTATITPARAVEALEVLRAFAPQYEEWMDHHSDDTESAVYRRHTFGDLRRARDLLSASPPDVSISPKGEGIPVARVREVLEECTDHLRGLSEFPSQMSDGPGAVSAMYTSLSFGDVIGLCNAALASPAVGQRETVDANKSVGGVDGHR